MLPSLDEKWAVQFSFPVPHHGLRATTLTVPKHATVRALIAIAANVEGQDEGDARTATSSIRSHQVASSETATSVEPLGERLRRTRRDRAASRNPFQRRPYMLAEGVDGELPAGATLPSLGFEFPPILKLCGLGFEYYLRTFANGARIALPWSRDLSLTDLVSSVIARVKPRSLRCMRLLVAKADKRSIYDLDAESREVPDVAHFVTVPLHRCIRPTWLDAVAAINDLYASPCGEILATYSTRVHKETGTFGHHRNEHAERAIVHGASSHVERVAMTRTVDTTPVRIELSPSNACTESELLRLLHFSEGGVLCSDEERHRAISRRDRGRDSFSNVLIRDIVAIVELARRACESNWDTVCAAVAETFASNDSEATGRPTLAVRFVVDAQNLVSFYIPSDTSAVVIEQLLCGPYDDEDEELAFDEDQIGEDVDGELTRHRDEAAVARRTPPPTVATQPTTLTRPKAPIMLKRVFVSDVVGAVTTETADHVNAEGASSDVGDRSVLSLSFNPATTERWEALCNQRATMDGVIDIDEDFLIPHLSDLTILPHTEVFVDLYNPLTREWSLTVARRVRRALQDEHPLSGSGRSGDKGVDGGDRPRATAPPEAAPAVAATVRPDRHRSSWRPAASPHALQVMLRSERGSLLWLDQPRAKSTPESLLELAFCATGDLSMYSMLISEEGRLLASSEKLVPPSGVASLALVAVHRPRPWLGETLASVLERMRASQTGVA